MIGVAKKVVGIDIDFSGIKATEVTRKGRINMVTKMGRSGLPAGTVVDGKVANVRDLHKGLGRLLKEQAIAGGSAVLGLRSSWVTVKTHRFPAMSKRELEKALEFEIPELVSFPIHSLDDVYYDYFINLTDDQGLEVVVVACPRENVLPYIEAVRAAGLVLEAVDVPAFGWRELIEGEGRRAYVEISEEQTTVQVTIGGVFKVLRVIPMGAISVRQGVAEAFACSPEEAQALMARESLDYLLLEGSGNKRVLRAAVQQFVGLVLQTLDFVRAQERAANFRSMLDELILLGDVADLKGLGPMLEKEVDLPVRLLKEIDNLRLTFEVIPPSRFSCFGSSLALGLRGLS